MAAQIGGPRRRRSYPRRTSWIQAAQLISLLERCGATSVDVIGEVD